MRTYKSSPSDFIRKIGLYSKIEILKKIETGEYEPKNKSLTMWFHEVCDADVSVSGPY